MRVSRLGTAGSRLGLMRLGSMSLAAVVRVLAFEFFITSEAHLRTMIELQDETRTIIKLQSIPRTRIILMSVSDFYDVGDDAEITGTIIRRLTGELMDPGTLVVRMLKPDGSIITMTYDNGVTETRLLRDPGDDARGFTPAGVFIATIDCDLPGTYVMEWKTTGAGKACEPTIFFVRAPRIPLV